jgi:hypothetical protein
MGFAGSKYCIVLREEIEWVQTIEAGCVDTNDIRDAFASWHPAQEHPSLYKKGNAAGEICEILSQEV